MATQHVVLKNIGRRLMPYVGRDAVIAVRRLLGRFFVPSVLTRLDVIQHAIDVTASPAFLEIGVFRGHLMSNLRCPMKLGVDPIPPAPVVAAEVRRGTARYFQCTSDDFFERFAGEVRKYAPRVFFIDGLHRFEQAYRDFQNCLALVPRPPWVILLHDCNPVTADQAVPADSPTEASRLIVRSCRAWPGDVWKAFVAIRRNYPDLYSTVLDCDCGIGVVVPISPGPAVAPPPNPELLSYDDFAQQRCQLLNLVSANRIYPLLRRLVAASSDNSRKAF